MNDVRERYVVTFKRDTNSRPDMAAALHVEPRLFVDGCEHLIECSTGRDEQKILHVPEIGVVEGAFSRNEAERLKADPRVAQVALNSPIVVEPKIRKLVEGDL